MFFAAYFMLTAWSISSPSMTQGSNPPSKVGLLTPSISKIELLTHSMIGLRMHTNMWTRMDTSEIAGTPMDGDPEDNSRKYEN